MNFLRFSELDRRGLAHGFTLRTDPALTSADLSKILPNVGLPETCVMAEQTHGSQVALVGQIKRLRSLSRWLALLLIALGASAWFFFR